MQTSCHQRLAAQGKISLRADIKGEHQHRADLRLPEWVADTVLCWTDRCTAVVFSWHTKQKHHSSELLQSSSYLFEGSEQLDADKSQFVAPDVFEQEGIVLQVFIGQVVLNLGDQLLHELGVGGLPALLLQLSTAGPRATVCEEQHT